MKTLVNAKAVELENGIVAIRKGKTIIVDTNSVLKDFSEKEFGDFCEKNKITKVMSSDDFDSLLNQVVKAEKEDAKEKLAKKIKAKLTTEIKINLSNDFCDFSSFLENAIDYYLENKKDINLKRDYSEII